MLSNKICILFDTNMLECRFDDKCLNLSQPKFKNEYYAIEKFIIKNNLQKRVKICISEISILELKKHLKSCFKSQSDSLNDKIKHFKKIFGDLIDFQIDKEYSSEKEYSEYIEEYFKNVFTEKILYPYFFSSIGTVASSIVFITQISLFSSSFDMSLKNNLP